MTMIASVLLQVDGRYPLGFLFSGPVIGASVVLGLIAIVGMWKMFVKAGQPGWAVLIPIYNAYVLLKIVGRPGWWLLLFFVPLVNIILALIVSIDVAKSFGQSAIFGVILVFLLGGIGYLILGFGNYRYLGPAGATAAA